MLRAIQHGRKTIVYEEDITVKVAKTMTGIRGYISRGAVVLFTLILFFGAISGLGQPFSTYAGGVQTQFCFILDGSGSISHTDWLLMVNGLADAAKNPDCFPHDGSVELTVVQFGWSDSGVATAKVEVGPIVVTAANKNSVVSTIRSIPHSMGSTPMACGIRLAAKTLSESPNFNPDIKQAINLVSDGEPNCMCDNPWNSYNCGQEPTNFYWGRVSAEDARDYLISTLSMTSDQDEFDAEFIGTAGASSNWLRDSIVWPQPGYMAPPFGEGGWVRVVPDAQTFADTVCEKIEVIILPTPVPTPTPAPTPTPSVPGMTGWGILAAAIMLAVLTPLALWRRRLAGTGR